MMWILIGGRCPTEEEKKFKRNPNLELFLSQEERSYFSPVFFSGWRKSVLYNEEVVFLSY
ncbi:MAG: hypothetical protein ABIM03_00455 [candidate division WOR-3 bacterium]